MGQNLGMENKFDLMVSAASLLMVGQSMTDTALAIGVDRKTLFRWREDEALFKKAMETAQTEMMRAKGGRLLKMIDDALDAVEYGLQHCKGDKRADIGLRLLSMMQLPQSVAQQAGIEVVAPKLAASHGLVVNVLVDQQGKVAPVVALAQDAQVISVDSDSA